MGIVIPCGAVNLKTCSVVCSADAGFANAEGEKSQCGLVVGITHHPVFVKTERFHLRALSDPHGQQRDMLCLKGSNQLHGLGIF